MVGAPPRRLTRAQRDTASAAVAACDPANTAAMVAAPAVTPKSDTATACVLVADPKGRKGARLLLGPAGLVGTDLLAVHVEVPQQPKKKPKKPAKLPPPRLLAGVTFGRSGMLDAFAAFRFHQPAVFTLDGDVVASTTILKDAAAPESYGGTIDLDLVHPPTPSQAKQLEADVDASRSELLRAAADQATLTDRARQLLQTHTVAVDDKQLFAMACKVGAEENALVYGCFEQSRIHVLRVDRVDLTDLMSVSLAHEMLHAVYAGLSTNERARVDAMTQAAYAQYGDQHLRDLVAEYEQREPGRTANELHSLLATEVATLPPDLEHHYARWFHNRAQLVANFRVFEDKLEALEDQASNLEQQLDALDAHLKELEPQIEDAGNRADSLGAQIDSLRAQGRIGESNDLVGSQNAAASEANGLLADYRSSVDQYNALVDQYNQLTANYRELYDSVSSVPFR
jgi:hypothetical protein